VRTQISKPGAGQEASSEANTKKAVPAGPHPKEVPRNEEAGQVDNSAKLHMGNTGFSLFHFGGPVALSTECKSNVMPRKEGMIGDFSQEYPTDHVESDHASNKKESTMEEYKYLFAASNGIKFSFF
jgi:hypothetical protein